MRQFTAVLLSFVAVTLGCPLAKARPLNADDITSVKDVADPQVSPDGNWVAYTVRSSDHAKDKRIVHVWMASWDGKQNVQLTNSAEGEHTPRWSPDGRSLAFLSTRGKEDGPTQLWMLDRLGGEAQIVTGFNGDVIDYDWSPDGKRLALIVSDEDPQKTATDKDKTPPPIVIDRYYFKEDESDYLGALRQHLYVLDLATRHAEILTPGKFDEARPAWSPDGKQIAFISKRGADPDRTSEFGMYVMAPTPGSEQRLLTTFQGEVGDSEWASGPVWKPDGREIAFVAAGDPKLIYYSTHHLAIVPVSSGDARNDMRGGARNVTEKLDRNVLQPRWSPDGAAIYFLLEDDRNQHLARLQLKSGKLDRLVAGRRESTAYDLGAKGRIALLDSDVNRPDEVYALEGDKTRALSRQNDEWLATLNLGAVREISFASKDGTNIGGFIVTPPGYVEGRKYPTLLWIHGGPVSQFANTFMPAWQIFAANGYVVVAANPRGSSGRGEAFATGIYADWGNKDGEDVLAAVDHALKLGIADPDQLIVGGWSYGGILTDQVIARDQRFKAAASGASIGNVLAGYGTDMYIREYELELGTPWQNTDVYLRNSYPLLHADRIKTPTLFMCGERDFNVPLLNSEQMYQALRSLGIDTQLIIYPGQNHGLNKPSYLRDRQKRYLEWFARYVKASSSK
jgi:dipeptidyl aminopeptidase/acylaminoacyl peptidase